MPRATLIDHWKHLTKTEKAAARKARRARYSVRWYGPDTNPATGKPVQHRKSFPENQQAEAHLFVGRLAGDDHTQRITAASVTVHTLLERHLAAKTDRAAKTVQTDRYHAQAVDDMFGSRFVNSITPTEIEVWTQRSTVARSSRKKQLEMLRSAIHRAMRDGLVTTDPTAGIDVALGHAEVNHLTLVELLAVLDAPPPPSTKPCWDSWGSWVCARARPCR